MDDRVRQRLLCGLDATEESLPACLELVVATNGGRSAIVSDHWQPTYNELNAAANRLARAILGLGATSGGRVAVLMQHEAPAITAIVAVLKAGGIVIALNPTHPVARLKELIEDSEPAIIVSDRSLRSLAEEIAGANCTVVGFEEHATRGLDHNLPIAISPDRPACISYTSGSTGRPKGVVVTHRQYLRTALVHTEALEISAGDRVALLGSLAAGQAMTLTWSTLLNGATLCPFPAIALGVTGLEDWITRRAITVFASSASIFRSFMQTLEPGVRFSAVRVVRLSSEPATSDDFKLFEGHFLGHCRFVCALASTETNNIAWSRWSRGETVPEGRLPVGATSAYHAVVIVDENGKPVAPGEVGEIVIHSRCLAAGYWRNPELTAQRFSDDIDGTGTRTFRTGDLGRFDSDGMLHLYGRRDDRIKIRGNRVELSEVEHALRRLAGIEAAVVEAVTRPEREPMLVGFVTVRGDQTWSTPELRRALRAMLPDHMVPSEFVTLPSLPLAPGGKVDRNKLRQDYRPRRQRPADQDPRTETEVLLAGIWAEALELADIGRNEDFFALGGDSLLAAIVAARVHGEVKVELNLAMFAEHSTLAGLALVIDGLVKDDDAPQLVAVPRGAPLPMSFWQERIWNVSQTQAGLAAYTLGRLHRITGSLDVRLLHECMDELLLRHEILRTTFALQDGKPVQVVQPPMPAPLSYFDLSGAADAEAQANAIFDKEAGWVFDLTQAPLVRFALVRLSNDDYRLLRVAHHIICDGPSWHIYFRELGCLYEERKRGAVPTTSGAPGLQYADYAAWQRKTLDPASTTFKETVSWWSKDLSAPPPPLRLPFTRAQASSDVVAADGILHWGSERQVSSRLNALGRARNATRLVVRLAAFAALLADETADPDVIVGMYVSARNRLQLQGMIGFFSNLVTLRFRFSPTKSFFEWLSIVRGQVLDVESRSDIPYDVIGDQLSRNGRRMPEIKAIFHVSSDKLTTEFAGIRLTWLEQQRAQIPWGFTLDFDDQNEQEYHPDGDSGGPEHCRVLFDPRVYDPGGVRDFVERYKRLLDAVSQHADWSLAELLAMSTAMRPVHSTTADLPALRRGGLTDLRLQGRIASLEARLERMDRERAETESRMLELERSLERGWLAKKFTPQLYRHRQYTPRPLGVPDRYRHERHPVPAPSIAITTPSFNQGDFIGRTIDSVLSQHYPKLIYHVQDAGSVDTTVEVLKQFGDAISWKSLPDRGQAQAINLGLSQARGDIMAYLNSDDMLLPGTLAYVSTFLERNPDIDIVYGHRIIVDRDDYEVGRWVLPRHDGDALKWADYIPQETAFWRRRVWDKLGGFDETFHYALDWEFFLRAQANGFRFARLPRFLGCFRVHGGQKTLALNHIGRQESDRLRERYLGRRVEPHEIGRALKPYFRRHIILHRLYKLPLLRY